MEINNEVTIESSEPDAFPVEDNTQDNTHKTFTEYQAAGADIHGSADTNYANGFPIVTITSPDRKSVV